MKKTSVTSWLLGWSVLSLECIHVNGLTPLKLTTGGKMAVSEPSNQTRRTLLQQGYVPVLAIGTTLFLPATGAIAQVKEDSNQSIVDREGRPFAPLHALLPATRCKVWVDEAYRISTSLVGVEDRSRQRMTLTKLDETLSNRPKLFLSTETLSRNQQQASTTTSAPLAQIATRVSSANKEQFQRNRANLSLPDQLAAVFNQADVERQWGMLKYRESQLEQTNEVRAAFNYYTSQLTFADYYVLTASKEDKKNMVRNDQLPSLTSVIASDLDLRDLYRNDFLTSIDDVKAEVSYQLRTSDSEQDVTDVVDLMEKAHTACTKWFDMIAPRDTQEALDVVLKESE